MGALTCQCWAVLMRRVRYRFKLCMGNVYWAIICLWLIRDLISQVDNMMTHTPTHIQYRMSQHLLSRRHIVRKKEKAKRVTEEWSKMWNPQPLATPINGWWGNGDYSTKSASTLPDCRAILYNGIVLRHCTAIYDLHSTISNIPATRAFSVHCLGYWFYPRHSNSQVNV